MTTVVDFVEDWIEIRAKLQRQLKLLQSGEMRTQNAAGDTTAATIQRIKRWIDELNGLLKEYSRAGQG
jgi:hypothetical protein